MDIFLSTVNPKRTRGAIVGKILDSQNKVMYEKNKFTKVNMVPVVTTDNPENPEDVTDNEGKIEEDKGKLKNP